MKRLIIYILIILFYVIMINTIQISSFNSDIIINISENSDYSSQDVVIGFSDNLDIKVERYRFYGKIIENNGNSNLYLFYLIKLPLRQNNFDYLPIHLSFLGLIFIVELFIFMFRRLEEFSTL